MPISMVLTESTRRSHCQTNVNEQVTAATGDECGGCRGEDDGDLGSLSSYRQRGSRRLTRMRTMSEALTMMWQTGSSGASRVQASKYTSHSRSRSRTPITPQSRAVSGCVLSLPASIMVRNLDIVGISNINHPRRLYPRQPGKRLRRPRRDPPK